MSNDIKPSRQELHNALTGVLLQLKLTGIDYAHDSFAEALHELNMWDFVFNQAAVIAHLQAYDRKLEYLLKKHP